jgi:hypothetical protein
MQTLNINKGTKTHKLFTALKEGDKVTASQAEKRFGIKNVSAEVSRIRQAGFAVYRKNRVAGNHTHVVEYVMGTPSREIVAAGYRAMQLGLV